MLLKPLLYEGRIMDRHQAYWFCQQRVRSWFANHPIVEFPLIKRPMLRPYGREEIVGTEISGCHHAKSECRIWQCAMEPSEFLVCHKAG